MNIQAEVSLYPLRTDAVGPAVEDFVGCLRRPGLDVEVGAMSTRIAGELPEVFLALAEAFARTAVQQEAVLIMKTSNACPQDNGLRQQTEGRKPCLG
jgi:uncharacterized protein YqgV (UPF0045/DUF77 family)